MSRCCRLGTTALHDSPGVRRAAGRAEPGLASACAGGAHWLLPGVVVALMPKCPACLVAYVAAATGLGISFPAAAWFRWVLLLACAVSLGYLVSQRVYRLSVRLASG